MAVLKTKVDRGSDDFEKNREALVALVEDLRALDEHILIGGSGRARERHLLRGKLLPRERLDTLLDDGSPFLEFSQLAAHQVYDDNVPAAGIITGIGRVSGQERMLYSCFTA